jgi:Cu(I)/Ag(I) efflux system membrane protein CusA/SilA
MSQNWNPIKRLIDEPLLVALLIITIVGGGWYAWRQTPVDAIPNIGENQVIIYTNWPGRSPKDVEDQITYPLSVAMLGVPGAESVRGKSLLGYSFVQVTFTPETDFYWARSRVSEKLATAQDSLPDGVTPKMGPDATALGQIYYYVLKPTDDSTNLAELRSMQDYIVKYALESVAGVSEVASIGGYIRHYQVEIDPYKLKFQNLPLEKVTQSLKAANEEVSARTLEQSGMEFIIRGTGYLGQGQGAEAVVADIEQTIVTSRDGVPVRIKDLGFVNVGTGFRRGALDYNGKEAVGGVVVMRLGENPKSVINRVKDKIAELEPSLKGVEIVGVYDRTGLVDSTIATLTTALTEEIIITVVVIMIFLMNLRSSLIVASTLPLAVLLAFIGMRWIDLDANIMSLAGIAIAIGNVVDMGIVITENIFRHLQNAQEEEAEELSAMRRTQVVWAATREVSPAILTATTTTIVSFIPVFFLTGRDGKLFIPLAWTKTMALVAALIVATALVPALCRLFLKTRAANSNQSKSQKLTQLIHRGYTPILDWAFNHYRLVLSIPVILMTLGLFLWLGIRPLTWPVQKIATATTGSPIGWLSNVEHQLSGIPTDDWIPLDEGSFFYMPTLYPAASFAEAMRILQTQDALIKEIPEVADVLGKIGRVESALDPAPVSMIETYIMLKPEDEWRDDMTRDKIWREVTRKATLPGVTPASFLQPIEGRVVMLQSGIKAPMAIRIYGDTLQGLAKATNAIARELKNIPQIDSRTVTPDIVLGKPYAEFHVDRQNSARFGMSISTIQNAIETTIAGKKVDETIEGRQRFPIEVRYPLSYRANLEALEAIPLVTPQGEVLQLRDVAELKTSWGPAMISSENGRLAAHVSFASSGQVGALQTVDAATKHLKQAANQGKLELPAGYQWEAVGSFRNQIEANQRLTILIPMVILINFLLIYLTFKDVPVSAIVFTGIPVAFGGGMAFVALTGLEINTAVWVGFIALFGIAVDDGVLQATYLTQVFRNKSVTNWQEIRSGVIEASLKRVRPCLMTTATTLVALLPILLSQGSGADVARGMAIPIFGGMLVALLELLIVPVFYSRLQCHRLKVNQ